MSPHLSVGGTGHRDMLARVLWGGRVSIAVGIAAMIMAITIGTLVGAIAGYFGRTTDMILMRIADVFISLPQLPLLLLIIYLFRDRLSRLFGLQAVNVKGARLASGSVVPAAAESGSDPARIFPP